ncbi:MAG: beta-propeller fold lactonase family protein, partial [Armatimonadota bacterium]|nr:beta-propeller fold lactonase family protein [Armatimonadota bacterium]
IAVAAGAVAVLPTVAHAQVFAVPTISSSNWGSVTTPVYGTSEAAPYTGAELFAGPLKLSNGNYFSGVLPNGRVVNPAGISTQVGMNPLGAALTPDGKFLVTTNDDERNGGLHSLIAPGNVGGYSLTVIDTASMSVVSQINSGPVYIGLQVTGSGPYTVWASGGPSNSVKVFSISTTGAITTGATASIPITPITPPNLGFVSNYNPVPAFNTADANGNKPPIPTGFNRTGDHITFPAGSALSPNGRYLYVACNGDNSLAVIDTSTLQVVRQYPVGYFPYGVSISRDGNILVSNWGISPYRFAKGVYGGNQLFNIAPIGQNVPDGFYVPRTSTFGADPKTSSVTLLRVSLSDATALTSLGSYYLGKPLDPLFQVGDTHPSASAVVYGPNGRYLYVTKSNDDSVAILSLDREKPGTGTFNDRAHTFDLSPIRTDLGRGQQVHGSYPNAIVVSSNNTRAYVAEAGLNSVAVLDTTDPLHPRLLGRIPTGWYPTNLALSGDGNTLYVVNAKGIGEDLNPKTVPAPGTAPTGVESFSDSNFIFGSVQRVNLNNIRLENSTVIRYNFSVHAPTDTSVVPIGGGPSAKIKHVFFILHENKTFDSMLGNGSAHFGPFASTKFNNPDGSVNTDPQFTGVSLNTQSLANAFATGVNYFSDSEESDAGHQFCASGTSTDYTQKTLLVKGGRGLLVNKNFEPEDYPESGYIYNNAARNGVTFKDYGALVR